MTNYKQKYDIRTSPIIEGLEDGIGDIIQNFKNNAEDSGHINYGLLDQLDISLYEKFLEIKANFDVQVPLRLKQKILFRI